MDLKDWMECADYRVTEGSDFSWDCFGSNAYSLSSWNGDHDGYSLNVIFDTRTQEVYSVEACDYKNSRAYRFINPNYRKDYEQEAKSRNDDDCAWDCVPWTDLEVYEDWRTKATAIVMGEDYDTRVSIPVEFTDEELFTYMKMAHERDMTFNKFVEEAIREAIKDWEKDPEGMKAKVSKWKADRDLT